MKTCSLCNTKDQSKFTPSFLKSTKTKGYCSPCSKNYHKEWYSRNKEHVRKDTNKRRKLNIKQNMDYIWELLSSSFCAVCKNNNILVLEFDHISHKKYAISELRRYASLDLLKRELSKCQILCSNCHSEKTQKDSNSWRWKRLRKKD